MGVRVLVVDDHPAFRRAAAAMVDSMPGFEVTASAATAEEAVALAVQVDLVLMDVNLPGMSGIDATRSITQNDTSPLVVLVSTYDADGFDPTDCGAAAYIAKYELEPAALSRVWAAAHPA